MKDFGWKFLRNDNRSGRGNEPSWQEGETRSWPGEIVMCRRGYHDSPSIYDALGYAPGNVLALTHAFGQTLSDKYPIGEAKRVSETLTIVLIRNVARELRLWGCDCVERSLIRAREAGDPNEELWPILQTVRLFANGEASASDLDKAGQKVAKIANNTPQPWADLTTSLMYITSPLAYAAARTAASVTAWSLVTVAGKAWDDEMAWQRHRLDALIMPMFFDQGEKR